MSTVRWFVSSGPDRSHMVDVSVFDTRREARECAVRLLMRDREENRPERPYKIERAEYVKSSVWGDTVRFSLVEKNYE